MDFPTRMLLLVTLGAILGVCLWEASARFTRRYGRLKAKSRPKQDALTDREIRAALRASQGSEPLWLAVHQLLAGQIADANAEAISIANQLEPPLATYYAGAARHLEIFRDFLLLEREEAMKEALEED